jgi:hypothetical protein
MKTVNFLANPSSPHVRQWDMVLQQCGMQTIVHGITQQVGSAVLVKHARSVGPSWLGRLPAPLAYALTGLWLRFQSIFGKPLANFVHAHNTSGYGLMARLSGLPYIITTYGTEIYTAPHKGFWYRRMIRSVLTHAQFITSSSPQMTDALVNQLHIPRQRIQEIYLGVAPVFLFSEYARKKGRSALCIPPEAKVWIANRRMTPLYRTVELVQAFIQFSQQASDAHLILIEGDADAGYRQQVHDTVTRGFGRVHIIRGFLTQDQLAQWLCTADFSISIPLSDQLSSSILESMRCRTVPVLGKLPAYQAITGAAEWVRLDHKELHANLVEMFRSTNAFTAEEMLKKQQLTSIVINELDRKDVIAKAVHALYQFSF